MMELIRSTILILLAPFSARNITVLLPSECRGNNLITVYQTINIQKEIIDNSINRLRKMEGKQLCRIAIIMRSILMHRLQKPASTF